MFHRFLTTALEIIVGVGRKSCSKIGSHYSVSEQRSHHIETSQLICKIIDCLISIRQEHRSLLGYSYVQFSTVRLRNFVSP